MPDPPLKPLRFQRPWGMGLLVATLEYCNFPTKAPDGSPAGPPCRQLVQPGALTCGRPGHIIPSSRWTGLSTPTDTPDVDTSGTIDMEELWEGSPAPGLKLSIPMPYDAQLELTSGVIDENAKNAFTRGQCHALAIVLADRLDAEPTVIVNLDLEEFEDVDGPLLDPTADDFENEDISNAWSHAVVQIGEDQYLDIEGVHNKDSLLRKYGDLVDGEPDGKTLFLKLNAARLASLWRYDWEGVAVPPAFDVAEQFVEPLLRESGLA